MKVLLINGSPHEHGCTRTALDEVALALKEEGIDCAHLWIGNGPVRGCIGCGGCARSGKGRCVFRDDKVDEALDIAADCGGLVIGSPVHYASAGGAITSFMDRMFYAGGRELRGKVGAVVVSARRAGTTATIDQLSKYFSICGMPVAPSQYWPMVHGNTPEEVRRDEEGLQIMRMLGRYMAYMMKAFDLAAGQGLLPPQPEAERKWTNFIR